MPIDTPVAAFEEKWTTFRTPIEEHAEGYKSSSAGSIVEELEHEGEKLKAFAVFIGWDSVSAHMKYRETQAFKDSIAAFRDGLKSIKMYHVTLQER